MPQPIVLASASKQRKELLERTGFIVREMPSNIAEDRFDNESAEEFVKRMAREKVLAVVHRIRSNLYPREGESGGAAAGPRSQEAYRWVIGADTVVVLGEQVFGKPAGQEEALEMLTRLSGHDHQVITGYCVFDIMKNKEGLQAVTSIVRFKNASSAEIEGYVAIGECLNKAGAYSVQGVGAYLIETLHGSYTNVIGLPLSQVVEMMQEMGAADVLPF